MMKQTTLIFLLLILFDACQSDKNTLHKENYWVSFPNEKAKTYAECLLDYVSEEKFELKKYQIFKISADSVIVRIFGKPKGNFKKQREISEFATELLANDFSKLCFQQKITVVQIGENFQDKNKFLQATSNGKVGYRDYKELAPN
jgi:hypothetical protein